jgi:hypothetical protein
VEVSPSASASAEASETVPEEATEETTPSVTAEVVELERGSDTVGSEFESHHYEVGDTIETSANTVIIGDFQPVDSDSETGEFIVDKIGGLKVTLENPVDIRVYRGEITQEQIDAIAESMYRSGCITADGDGCSRGIIIRVRDENGMTELTYPKE